MTKEEKVSGLYNLKEYLVKNPIELDGHKSLPITLIDYAIEALEKEPTLDKTRVEIKEKILYDLVHPDLQNEKRYGFEGGLMYAREVIEKYL